MHAIDSKENFKQELSGVLTKIEDRIETLSEMLTFHNGQAVEIKLSTLNSLKLHRFKCKELLEKIEDMENTKWEANKEAYQQVFEKANELLA